MLPLRSAKTDNAGIAAKDVRGIKGAKQPQHENVNHPQHENVKHTVILWKSCGKRSSEIKSFENKQDKS